MVTARPHPRWLPLAVAACWLALGWAWLARGAAHPGVAYRPWAFDHHAYSDLLAMGGDRYFGGGRPTPYLGDRVEYPPLLALALWLPSFASHAPLAYFTVSYAFLAACGLLAVALLLRLRGADAWWLAGGPALAYYGGLNWDLLPIALLAAAALAHERGRLRGAGALAALGASAKLFPLVLVPPLLGAGSRPGRGRALLAVGAAFAAVLLAVNLPLALAAPDGWSWFWRFNAGRGAENSVWELLRVSPRLAHLVFDAGFLNAVTALLVALAALAAALAARAAARDPGRAVRLGAAFVLVVWIGTNKVWSPQYALWACAAGALAAAPRALLALHAAVAVADYHVAFEARATRGLVHYFDALYLGEEVLRFGAYALLAAWLGRELWRVARAAGDEPPPYGPVVSP
ncbi:glycosyltransferase 87 family protein [Anaeromyxobacter diazotrophicus]|uniref:DUF2029 domain-containing protein n=1 Tax=Anaeromyxobacter diazotrophicus TaxID=2590199 RepID=A0A7I9VQB1_9BACT|nr:glycosyltransferase 87 family protein [Anaeromyxobacter diazotrophicus]GEJ58602.1 hypothetical protein AMYX_33430 [Anaeromyxobacter diazotrophicus]